MTKFAVGFVCGLVVATVGFSGVAKLGDQAVQSTQQVLQEQVKK